MHSVEGVPRERLEVEVPEEGFVLGVVGFHFVILIIIAIFQIHLCYYPINIIYDSCQC